jgi:uncharacterized protein (DUF362 family)
MLDRIAIIRDTNVGYPFASPFHPSERYPEYPWKDLSETPNLVYDAVRKLLIDLGMDLQHTGSPAWNPFKDLIQPEDTVLVKPNFVLHFHHEERGLESINTHTSVVRAVLDYVNIALQGKGRIIIGDAPIQSCRIEEILSSNGLLEVIDFIRANSTIEIEFRDLREEVIRLEKHSIISRRRKNPVEVICFDLGKESSLEGIQEYAQLFAVDGYDYMKTVQSHTEGHHFYDINALTFQVDAIINIPKLKTHKKAGMTGAIKNFVGLNANKDRLPHFRLGDPSRGGDEYPVTNHFREAYRALTGFMNRTDNKAARYVIVSALFLLRKIFHLQKFELIEGGSWPGNDTLWRMIYDLTRIIYFGDVRGEIHPNLQRKVFHLVDGIISGEGIGPLRPIPKKTGVLISGFNPFLVDATACELMGFDYLKVKSVAGIQDLFPGEPSEAKIILNGQETSFENLGQLINPSFKPPDGWNEIVKH